MKQENSTTDAEPQFYMKLTFPFPFPTILTAGKVWVLLTGAEAAYATSDNLFWFSAILQQVYVVAVARSQMKSENGNVGISHSLHDFLWCFSFVLFYYTSVFKPGFWNTY